MRAILVLFLATFIGAEIFNSSKSRTEQYIRDESFEEKLRKAYDLLKNEPNADDTMRLLEQMHNMEEEINGNLTTPPKQTADLLKKLKNYVDIENRPTRLRMDTVEDTNEKSKVDAALFQGDVILTEEQALQIMEGMKKNNGNRSKRQAFRPKNYFKTLWSKGSIRDEAEGDFSKPRSAETAKTVFKKAAAMWSWDTCINFGETNSATDRISVIEGHGCWSHLGRIGKEQKLSLGAGCESVGTAAHEIGHALGLFHTQSRHDRNNFIYLYLENLISGWKSQFTRQTEETNYNYDLPYDYGSVMHYGATRVSRNGKPYMIPHDAKFTQTLGSPFISFYDKLMINMHYGCLDQCNGKPKAACKNDGYPHPRNCSKCICPSGYGGTYCDERPEGCGANLIATDFYQKLNNTVGRRNYQRQYDHETFHTCFYWIQGPKGSRIEVKFENYTVNLATDGCVFAGVEIKTLADKRQTGYRFCSPKYAGTTLVSTHSIVPIITYSKVHMANTVISYRIAEHPSEIR